MKAIKVSEFGAPEVLHLIECDTPVCGEQDVLVKVAAAAINPIDYKIREGSHLVCPMLTMPTGIGFDFSGEVIARGVAVTDLAVGDQVLGIAGFPTSPGTYQEQLVTPASACIKAPDGVALQELAGLPLAGLTAWQAVHRHGDIKAGQRVLIHAAAGGVGCFAVQLAKQTGAEVVVTASQPKHAMLQGLGADICLDYRAAPFYEEMDPVDVVIDLVGGQTGIDSLKVLKPDGILVTVPSATKDAVLAAAEAQQIEGRFFLMAYELDDLQQLLERVADQRLKIMVSGKLPLAEAALAHQQIESGRVIGKLLLLP
ncbi:MAG: NADP-dependent oxidoreductase [Candidatus Pelagadaptatus aseana]|uniref:NADP-dependent oxidoreductase n=1 Tax=Candidatus Pelagadaptatus aseana TaxID=3120508 RepID=UPI0039B29B83